MLEKLSKMSAQDAMIDLAGTAPRHGELPNFLRSIARNAGISFRTARSLWNGEIADPEHKALQKVKREARQAKARREARDLAAQYETIADGLNAKDQDFYSADVAALVHAARILRGTDRT